jgi:hypothetical protein
MIFHCSDFVSIIFPVSADGWVHCHMRAHVHTITGELSIVDNTTLRNLLEDPKYRKLEAKPDTTIQGSGNTGQTMVRTGRGVILCSAYMDF